MRPNSFVSGLVAAVIITAMARGIVMAFGLDLAVARLIQETAASEYLDAISWFAAGVFGLLVLVAWITFHVDERLGQLLAPRPGLGSLVFDDNSFLATFAIHGPTGRTDADLSVKLRNKSASPIVYEGTISGEANGKIVAGDEIQVQGFMPARESATLIVRILDVPSVPFQPGSPSLYGKLLYDLSYRFAERGRRSRRTMRRMAYDLMVPARTGNSGHRQHRINVLFLEQVEE